ncbi:hypothetical protein OS493_005120 [Desmophyllum pertusum]|uniref:PWWP domain-containing protein n=1 Tax=Desmophyllum pertusum TaxID=174260 RepID=A0A9X0CTB5_9CNID|nr:hypothetical protein OS493_005120 [Desmophyllum pertusum]
MSNFKTGDFCFVKDLGIAKWPCRVVESQGDSITISYIDPAGSWNNRRSSVDISLVTAYNGEKTGGEKPRLQKAYKAIYKQLPSLQRKLLWRKHGDGLPVQKPHSDNTLPPGPPKVQKAC